MSTTQTHAVPDGHDAESDETLVASSRISPSILGRWIREATGATGAEGADAHLAEFGAVDECSFGATEGDARDTSGAVPRLWDEDAADPDSTVAWDFSAGGAPDETKVLESTAERTMVLDWNAAVPAAWAAPPPPGARAEVYARPHAVMTYRKGFERADRGLPIWARAVAAAFLCAAVGAAVVTALG